MVGKDSSPLPPTTTMEDIRARISKDSTGAVDRGAMTTELQVAAMAR